MGGRLFQLVGMSSANRFMEKALWSRTSVISRFTWTRAGRKWAPAIRWPASGRPFQNVCVPAPICRSTSDKWSERATASTLNAIPIWGWWVTGRSSAMWRRVTGTNLCVKVGVPKWTTAPIQSRFHTPGSWTATQTASRSSAKIICGWSEATRYAATSARTNGWRRLRSAPVGNLIRYSTLRCHGTTTNHLLSSATKVSACSAPMTSRAIWAPDSGLICRLVGQPYHISGTRVLTDGRLK